ncbi:hypothetical protein SEA_KEANU_107 [Streptomyces phage Keanu]|nr:hypothetical protein SEA_KEANU_107 [Streptomyces phage Keanu]
MTDNVTPEAASKPEWMHFINFDGRVTGQTAKVIKDVAASRGLTPQQIIAELLHEAINGRGYGNPGRTEIDAKVEPMTINAGNGGFHILTFVTDGYGNLVAENSAGEELARTEWVTEDDEHDTHDEFRQLAAVAFAKQAAQTTD